EHPPPAAHRVTRGDLLVVDLELPFNDLVSADFTTPVHSKFDFVVKYGSHSLRVVEKRSEEHANRSHLIDELQHSHGRAIAGRRPFQVFDDVLIVGVEQLEDIAKRLRIRFGAGAGAHREWESSGQLLIESR